jgi:hypothetical protein
MKERHSVRVLVGTSVAFLLVGLNVYAGTSKTYELTEPVLLGETEVTPGVYKVKWQDHTSEATVTLWAGKRKVAAATGKWVDRNLTYASDAFICQTGQSRSRPVVEIQFAGKHQALVLDQTAARSTSILVPLCSVTQLGDGTRSMPSGACQHIRFLGTPRVPSLAVFPTTPSSGNSFPGWNQRVAPQRK